MPAGGSKPARASVRRIVPKNLGLKAAKPRPGDYETIDGVHSTGELQTLSSIV
jgi:hypothetical protein